MLASSVRPYTEQEKKQLIARLPSRWTRFESFTGRFIFLVGALLLPCLAIDKYYPVSTTNQLLIIFAVGLLALFITRYTQKNYEGSRTRKQVLAAMATGQAEVFHVTTNRAIEREDPEDFGVAFYLEVQVVGTPKLLYLQGQYLDELTWEKAFPTTDFVLTRRLDTHELLDIQLRGQYFEPERKLPAFTKARWQTGDIPIDGEVLDGRLDELTE